MKSQLKYALMSLILISISSQGRAAEDCTKLADSYEKCVCECRNAYWVDAVKKDPNASLKQSECIAKCNIEDEDGKKSKKRLNIINANME